MTFFFKHFTTSRTPLFKDFSLLDFRTSLNTRFSNLASAKGWAITETQELSKGNEDTSASDDIFRSPGSGPSMTSPKGPLLRGQVNLAKNVNALVISFRRRTTLLINDIYRRLAELNHSVRVQSKDLSADANRLLNRITGYDSCEKLKLRVSEADQHFRKLKGDLQKSRQDFDAAIQARSRSQKELNSLLQRKQTWADEDLMRFTEVYRKEMKLEQSESEERIRNERLEQDVDRAHQALMDALRERYQEEQLWSDKIRRVSTFGTFSLMTLNVILFLLIQLQIEPKKKKTLLTNFDAMIAQRLENATTNFQEALNAQAQSLLVEINNRPRANDVLLGEDHRYWIIRGSIGMAGLFVIMRLLFVATSAS